MHVVMSKEKSKVKMFIRGITDVYDKYWRYNSIQNKGKDVVGKVQKKISYAGTLHQV